MSVSSTNGDSALFPPLTALTPEQVASAAQTHGEPEWLLNRRVAAWNQYVSSEPPFWGRTDLRHLQLDALQAPRHPVITSLQLDEAAASQGVVFLPLQDALKSHATLIEQKLASAVDSTRNRFVALQSALWQDGVFVYVPKNVEVAAPLHITYTFPQGASAIFPRTLVIVERNARVSLVEEFVGADSGLCCPVSEIFVESGAEARYATVQQWGEGVYHLGAQKVVLGRDAGCTWTSASLGAKVQHIEAEARMEGDGSRVDWLGVTFARGTQTLLTAPILRHVGLSTESHMEFKTAVSDTGYSVFDGMVKIEKGAQGTNSRLEEHALHLNAKARNDSIPGLEIDANDVKAGHASTSGQIDPEQIFYMQARGLNAAEATRMIVMGFFEPVLEQIAIEEVRTRLADEIEARVR